MNTKLFFLISSLALIVLTIVTICTAPIINGALDVSHSEFCQKDIDDYNYYKEEWKNPDDTQKQSLSDYKQDANICKRKKAALGLEYSSLIFDIVLGAVCCLLGLLHYFDVGKFFLKFTGIIGLATGVIRFILTVIYLGYSAYIFNNDYSDETILYDNGAYLKYTDGKYVCNYNEDDRKENKYYDKAKFKDLGKKQYNYDSKRYKEFLESTDTTSIKYCSKEPSGSYNAPGAPGGAPASPSSYKDTTTKESNCEYIWKDDYASNSDYDNKYIYDKWLTSIIFSAFVCVCNLGVAIFGLLIFLNGDSSSGHSPI